MKKNLIRICAFIFITIICCIGSFLFGYRMFSSILEEKETLLRNQQTHSELRLEQKEVRGIEWFNENGFLEREDGSLLKEEEQSRMIWFSSLPRKVDFYGTTVTIAGVQLFENQEENGIFSDWVYVDLDVSNLTYRQVKELINGSKDKSELNFLIAIENDEFSYDGAYFNDGHIYCSFNRRSDKCYNGERITVVAGQKNGDYTLFYCLDGKVELPIKSTEEAPCYSLTGENLKEK